MTEFLSLTPDEWNAIRLSCSVAALSLLILAVPGIAIGYCLARKTFPGKTLLDAIVHLPLILPPIAVGYILLLTLGTSSPMGRFMEETLGIRVAFTFWAAVIASSVMAFPLMVRSVRVAMELVDPRLEDAAATLGASPIRTFCTVTLPLAIPGVITGLILAFARSLGEFGATIVFAGNIEGETRTLPLSIFSLTQQPGETSGALRMVVFSCLLSFAALLVSDFLTRRARRIVGDR